ncbi:hypothetical protein LIER_20020 [Lithospermum erythrorhizon]|uniref:Uncharacterized protein n=1 Tax=Lithospermum erythrorhizon TaxID=34254 RepID=A0AAV3QKV0_LITER
MIGGKNSLSPLGGKSHENPKSQPDTQSQPVTAARGGSVWRKKQNYVEEIVVVEHKEEDVQDDIVEGIVVHEQSLMPKQQIAIANPFEVLDEIHDKDEELPSVARSSKSVSTVK